MARTFRLFSHCLSEGQNVAQVSFRQFYRSNEFCVVALSKNSFKIHDLKMTGRYITNVKMLTL